MTEQRNREKNIMEEKQEKKEKKMKIKKEKDMMKCVTKGREKENCRYEKEMQR